MININKYNGSILKCQECGREYEYYRSISIKRPKFNKGHTTTHCNTCCQARRRNIRRKQILELRGKACELCGYDACPRALSFHHVNPSQKKFSISGSELRSWERVQEEIGKCILICMNCHAEIHDGMHPEFLKQ